jgi:hypothetical protein
VPPIIVVFLLALVAIIVVLVTGFIAGNVFRRRGTVLGSRRTTFYFDAIGVVLAVMVGTSTLVYAYSNESRLDRQEKREFANNVFLSEAPQYYSGPDGIGEDARCPEGEGCRNRVVMNASGVPITNVWIEFKNGARQKIVGVQRCTLYDLKRYPRDDGQIEPAYLYFTDAHGDWRRSWDGSLDSEYDGEIPEDAEFRGSNPLNIRDCSG